MTTTKAAAAAATAPEVPARFDPAGHLRDIKGNDYLDVKWRLVWLRQEHPDWNLSTRLISAGDPVVMEATLYDADGKAMATGHAEYPRHNAKFPPVMKCETAAIGRCLAHAGFGTQFAGADVEEVEVVDSPVERRAPAAAEHLFHTWDAAMPEAALVAQMVAELALIRDRGKSAHLAAFTAWYGSAPEAARSGVASAYAEARAAITKRTDG